MPTIIHKSVTKLLAYQKQFTSVLKCHIRNLKLYSRIMYTVEQLLYVYIFNKLSDERILFYIGIVTLHKANTHT